MIVRFIITLIFLVYLILVVTRNNQVINMDLFFSKFDISLFLLILISLLLGMLLASLGLLKTVFRLKRENRNLKKEKK